MADMNMPQKNGKRKLQIPRVDLTPMVDLGFLLITFFIFTTTMSEAKTMEVNMPYKPTTETSEVPGEGTIVLIPTSGHRIAYYNGFFDAATKPLMAAHKGKGNIRQVLLDRQKEIAALPASFSAEAHKLHVIIRPADDCTYEDVVSLLDEMNIVQVPYYAIDDISEEEAEWVKR
jgi:biopolymer transport protein ExbD